MPLEGDDVSDLIEQHRDELPFSDQLPTFDPPKHTAHRGLLMRLITPKRLKENEEFMWRLADRQIDEFVDRGECEFVGDYAKPFTLSSSPTCSACPRPSTRRSARSCREVTVPTRRSGAPATASSAHTPLEFLYGRFSDYVEERRREPRDDVLTGLATATFPDGSTPEVIDVVRVAANLFAAGQETTVRLLTTALQLIAERPDLQQLLRDERERIPDFVEECLRIESPVKGDFRLARVATQVGGVDIPAGATVMVLNGAANRDPRRFDDPGEFRVDRRNSREHLTFGRGIHACPGGAARPFRGPRVPRAVARPHGRHPDLRGRARPRRRPPLQVRPDLHPARPDPAPPRVRAGRLKRRNAWISVTHPPSSSSASGSGTG